MTEVENTKQKSSDSSSNTDDIENIVSNRFGQHSLFAINRDMFETTDANTRFLNHFGESLFKEETFYIIAGTDSGLLYQHIKSQGIPKGSRYLFVELPQILALLEEVNDPGKDLAVTNNENWLDLAQDMGVQKFALQGRLVLLRSLGVVHGHYSDYPPFWHQLKERFDAYCFTQKIALSNYFFTICQINNLTENQTPAICLKDAFKGKTAVLLAGGPSLDKLLPWVKQHRSNLLVVAVSRISSSLLQAGIQPDISVSVDPQAINLNVSLDMLEFQNGTLLAYNNHVSPSLLSSWGGSKTFIGSRYPWATSIEPENLPMSDGTTVTDSAFALAVETGVTQIILGGADFCFNQEGYTHASGTPEHTNGPRSTLAQQQVRTNSGMMADTLQTYQTSAMSIDLQAQNAIALGCRTINPASEAMHLPHVEHLELDAIQVAPLEQPAQEILASSMPSTDKHSHTRFYKEVLGEVNRVLKELRAIKELSSKAIIYNRKLFAKGEQGAGIHNKAKVERIEEQLNKKYVDIATFIRQFGITRFIPIRQLEEDKNVEDLEESCRLYHQAFVKTSDELIEILGLARTRTMSRLEEEKTKPNIQHLLDQWQRDQQPGRAIQWGLHHANYVNQLPETQQQALHTFQDTFGEMVKELGRNYIKNIELGVWLDNVTEKGQEYFLSRDKEALLRLLVSLQEQRDQKRVTRFISLVQGYLAELRNEPKAAIEAYQSIVKGPAQVKALMRVFELYSQTQDYDSAREVLKVLSRINPAYSPMYADMLQFTGDIDNAVETYTDYLLANPDDLNTMMKLGKLFQQCGSAEGVSWTMSYILGKDPHNQTAQKILSELEHDEEAGSTPP